jgi:hypothetical protein
MRKYIAAFLMILVAAIFIQNTEGFQTIEFISDGWYINLDRSTDRLKKIQAELKAEKLEAGTNTEIIALIAYLQRVGTDIKNAPKRTVAALTN